MAFIDNPALYEKIESAIDSLRPFFEADQGDIRLVGVEKNMVVKVRLLGALQDMHHQ